MNDDMVDKVAWAIAGVIASRRCDGVPAINDQRRAEARAAIAAMESPTAEQAAKAQGMTEGIEMAIAKLGEQEIAGPFHDTGKDDDWRFRAKLARKEQVDTDRSILRLLCDDAEKSRRIIAGSSMSDDLVKRLRDKKAPGDFIYPEPGVIEMTTVDDPLTTEAAARIERLETALRNIRELNMMEPGENGHRWASSDLVEQEIIAALQEGQA